MTMLPDQHYINEIRKRLWSGGVHGQASVMVGAGFSRNAQKITPDGPEFPLWWELGAEMYKALNPGKEISSSSIDPLKLATEYEASFGREALNQFLTQIIPDAQHSPDRLHELLMSLPWSDIYTTNYDTLLERTRQKIHDKKYDVIYSPADIPGKEKPRIVKLHGSFPSYRPFIFTEEDYRTYPQKFAPFVNMVQQSIMENIFCLIGFSGDDPNFLNWIGWVRDNLGESMPAIYLCGLLNLSDSQKHTLRQKKIITVDISPLFPKEKWIDGAERHAKGLEWFLLNLMYGEPVDISRWGIDKKMPKSKSIKWKTSPDLPKIPDDPYIIESTSNQPDSLIFSSFSVHTLETKILELDKLYKYWKEERYSYPGWVICPEVNRRNLWRQTQNWIDDIFTLIKDIEYDDQALVILYELNWRLEKCLFPLFEEWTGIIDNVVKKFYSYLFLDDINISQSENEIKLTPKDEQKKATQDNCKFNKIELREAWLNLASALMRNAREDHKEQEFQYWKDTLKETAILNNNLREKWYYEQCLFHLSRFEFEEIKQVLNNWKPSSIFPFWVVKRASILAEIGNVEEALQDTEKALIDIRMRRASINEVNYSLLSQESYAMVACEYYERIQDLNSNQMKDSEEIIQKYRSRYKELAFYFCDPKQEFEKLSLYLEKPLSKLQPVEKTERGFYPGTINITFSGGNTNNILKELLPAFQFLRLYEETGLPIRVGYSTCYAESIIKASKNIASSAPLYAVGMMFRTGQNKSISEWLDLIRINAMPQNHVNYLAKILTQFIEKIYPQIFFISSYTYENQKLMSSASLALLILTRLSIQVQEEPQIEKLIKFTVTYYKNLHITNNRDFKSSVSELWKAIFYSITESQLSNYLLEFVQLPVANERNYFLGNNDNANQWPEPFIHFPDFALNTFEIINGEPWKSAIVRLIDIVNDGNNIPILTHTDTLFGECVVSLPVHQARSWAIFRLYKIHVNGGLNSELQSHFANALWSQIDQNTGLPNNSNYLYENAYLYCPEPELGKAKQKLKEYLLDLNFPVISLNSYSGIDKRYLNNLISVTKSVNSIEDIDELIDWSQGEAENLLAKISIAINEQKNAIANWYKMPFSMKDIQSFLELIGDLLILVILPRIKNSEENIESQVRELIEILRQISESSVYAVLPCMLLISPESYDIKDIARNLKQGLFSTDKHLIRQSLKGLYYWLAYANKKELPEPPGDLLKKLIDVIYSLRQTGLDDALYYTYLILKKFPNYFQKENLDFETLSEGLGYLLKETQYPKNWTELDLQDTQSCIPNADKPTYREYASRLAHQLYVLLETQGREIPSVLNKWKDESLNDKLPQIRKIWLNQ